MIDAFKQQGWVPSTCTLTDLQARLLWSLVMGGTDPCRGCNHDRAVCRGRPKTVDPLTEPPA